MSPISPNQSIGAPPGNARRLFVRATTTLLEASPEARQIGDLLEAIFVRYGLDFRSYALSSLKRRMLTDAQGSEAVFRGRQVLIVDDDVRNIYALSSVLEEAGMNVLFAENGRAGLEVLTQNPGIGIVLMDVMMPEMDGYETMRRIRQMPEYKSLPVLALTAKAMKGDREKCLAAGASDYVTKPVDPDQLLSLMRVWLYSSQS